MFKDHPPTVHFDSMSQNVQRIVLKMYQICFHLVRIWPILCKISSYCNMYKTKLYKRIFTWCDNNIGKCQSHPYCDQQRKVVGVTTRVMSPNAEGRRNDYNLELRSHGQVINLNRQSYLILLRGNILSISKSMSYGRQDKNKYIREH